MLGHLVLLLLITFQQLCMPVPKVHYNAYAATETAELVSCAGVVKGNMHLDKNFFSSVSVGCLLSLACATSISTVSSLDIKKTRLV